MTFLWFQVPTNVALPQPSDLRWKWNKWHVNVSMILCAHSSHMHLNCSISLDCLGKMQCMCPMLMNLYARIVAGTSLSASEYALYRAYAKHDMNVSHLHLCPGCISVICKGRWDHHTELMEKAVDVRVWESQTSDIDKYKFLSDPCSRLANDSCENCCDCTKLRRRIVYAYCMQKTNPRICKYIFFLLLPILLSIFTLLRRLLWYDESLFCFLFFLRYGVHIQKGSSDSTQRVWCLPPFSYRRVRILLSWQYIGLYWNGEGSLRWEWWLGTSFKDTGISMPWL